jgi:hypothetical protein
MQWFRYVILTIWVVKIGRIAVLYQSRQKVLKISSQPIAWHGGEAPDILATWRSTNTKIIDQAIMSIKKVLTSKYKEQKGLTE